METVDTRVAPTTGVAPVYVQWGPVIAGAIAGAALALVLHTFAAAIGLAVSSTAPTWRDASVALWIMSGLYLILAALASYGFGGYIAGRMRTRLTAAHADEVEFRDGAHGLIVWALATLLTGLLALAAAQSLTRPAAPSGGGAGSAQSIGGENLIAYELDRLFRAERRPPDVDMTYTRSEAARILLTTSSHTGVTAEDRTYLVRLVATRTGLSPADSERRVDETIARSRTALRQARRSTVILAFMAGAAALLGAAAAWFAACAGGRQRDGETAPSRVWAFSGPAERRLT